MSQPSLKLTFGKPKVKTESSPPPEPAKAPQKKLTLKFGAKRPAEPEPESSSAPKSKKKRASSPSKPKAPKVVTSKKRAHGPGEETAPAKAGGPKRIKFSSKPPPSLRIKSKGQPLQRPKGVGYDSEASDAEVDPAIEEDFILRMQPGEDCDYLRQAIEEKRLGPKSQGGADIWIKSLTRDARRSVVNVRGHLYAASLVDLPCVVEGLKSWDKRGWYKSADICQMLLVLGRINSEDEARNFPLPKDIDQKTWQYAHGLTPPLRWVRKRRFRERINNHTIEAVELDVARLIQKDQEAIEPPEFEVYDHNQYMRETSQLQSEADGYGREYYDDEQDAEGEYEEDALADVFEDDLAAEMEAALAAGADGDTAVLTTEDGTQIAVVEEAGTPATKPSTPAGGGDSSGDESDSASSAGDGNEDLDEDTLEQQQLLQQQREEIEELEKQIKTETARWEQMPNPILKSKLGRRVQDLKQALALKKVSIGETEDA